MIINEKKVTGFKSVEDVEKFYPALLKLLPKTGEKSATGISK